MTMAVKAPSTMHISSGVPATARHLFQEFDIDSWDESDELVVNVIIQRLLERGTTSELKWLFATYGKARVARWVREGGFRGLSKLTFGYWLLILKITEYDRPPWFEYPEGSFDLKDRYPHRQDVFWDG